MPKVQRARVEALQKMAKAVKAPVVPEKVDPQKVRLMVDGIIFAKPPAK